MDTLRQQQTDAQVELDTLLLSVLYRTFRGEL
jgi:hypothetical protein